MNVFSFFLARSVGLVAISISKHPASPSRHCGERGREQRVRGGQMAMDGDQVHFLPLCEQVNGVVRPHGSPVCRPRVKGVGGTQPCLPRGPPCLRRQDPSSVSKAIFTNAWKLLLLSLRLSCEGTEHRQIPSLGTHSNESSYFPVFGVTYHGDSNYICSLIGSRLTFT